MPRNSVVVLDISCATHTFSHRKHSLLQIYIFNTHNCFKVAFSVCCVVIWATCPRIVCVYLPLALRALVWCYTETQRCCVWFISLLRVFWVVARCMCLLLSNECTSSSLYYSSETCSHSKVNHYIKFMIILSLLLYIQRHDLIGSLKRNVFMDEPGFKARSSCTLYRVFLATWIHWSSFESKSDQNRFLDLYIMINSVGGGGEVLQVTRVTK